MKVTSVEEAKELEQYVSPAGCERFGKHHKQVRKLYARAYGLNLEQMKGYEIHHICRQGVQCVNPDHLCLMTPSDHMRLHSTGRPCSAETRQKIGKAHKGKVVSAETRAKIGKAHKGRTLSDEHKAKLSQAKMGNQYGKGNKGKTFSDDHKAKLSQSNKGKTLSDDHKAKLSQSAKGRTLSDETKEKLSVSVKIYWARKRGDTDLVVELQRQRDALDKEVGNEAE